jgi:excisionase family DNA binding protein
MHKGEIVEGYAKPAGWLTAQEAAEHLRVKTRTLLQWVRQKKIPGYVLSGNRRKVWRFRKVDLDRWLLAQGSGVICSPAPSVLVTKGEAK